MRLREMQTILRKAMPVLLAVSFEGVTIGGVAATRLRSWRPGLEAVRLVARVPALSREAIACLNGPWNELAGVGDFANLAPDAAKRLSDSLLVVIQTGSALLRALDVTLPEESPFTVSIRLPPGLTDLAELSKIANDIHINVAHPTNMLFGPCVEFQGFDTGTNWIEIAVQYKEMAETGAAILAVGVTGQRLANGALKFIGGLVDLAFKIGKEKQQQKVAEYRLRTIKATTETLEAVHGLAQTQIKEAAQQGAVSLVRKHAPTQLQEAQMLEATAATSNAALGLSELLMRDLRLYPKLLEAPPSAPSPGGAVDEEDTWPDPDEISKLLVSGAVEQLTQGLASPEDAKAEGAAKDKTE